MLSKGLLPILYALERRNRTLRKLIVNDALVYEEILVSIGQVLRFNTTLRELWMLDCDIERYLSALQFGIILERESELSPFSTLFELPEVKGRERKHQEDIKQRIKAQSFIGAEVPAGNRPQTVLDSFIRVDKAARNKKDSFKLYFGDEIDLPAWRFRMAHWEVLK